MSEGTILDRSAHTRKSLESFSRKMAARAVRRSVCGSDCVQGFVQLSQPAPDQALESRRFAGFATKDGLNNAL
jgi:hypothetical protein